MARPGARDSDALDQSWDWLLLANAGAPAIRFVTERGDEIMGTGEGGTSIGARRVELMRAMTGRRTEAEIAAFVWEPVCDPPLIVGTPIFTMRTESMHE